jgi:hypothetical protein
MPGVAARSVRREGVEVIGRTWCAWFLGRGRGWAWSYPSQSFGRYELLGPLEGTAAKVDVMRAVAGAAASLREAGEAVESVPESRCWRESESDAVRGWWAKS